ncbi:hypothetical protein C7M84_022660 [Penaeus vannamei]|uniref:Uncharacterized protein n=1 Tax=Penaeus vannamei TaxID=6689 RepID=A0A3R7QZ21_PENVA|nr:hypothetical protein C7M84_022660 [Penaeus vannamei]
MSVTAACPSSTLRSRSWSNSPWNWATDPESVTGAALTFLFNVVALVFLGLFQIPSDYMGVSYVLLACVSLTIIPLMFVKETHKRSEADRKEISHITGSASNTIA